MRAAPSRHFKGQNLYACVKFRLNQDRRVEHAVPLSERREGRFDAARSTAQARGVSRAPCLRLGGGEGLSQIREPKGCRVRSDVLACRVVVAEYRVEVERYLALSCGLLCGRAKQSGVADPGDGVFDGGKGIAEWAREVIGVVGQGLGSRAQDAQEDL